MGVRADDLLRFQTMLRETTKNCVRIIAGIDDYRFTCSFITQNCAVALNWSDGERFNNHGLLYRCGSCHFQGSSFRGSPTFEICAANEFFITRWKLLPDGQVVHIDDLPLVI